MIIRPRSDWTSEQPRGIVGPDEIDSLPNFFAHEVEGIVVHWVGSKAGMLNVDPVRLFRQGWTNDVINKGYSDIMYNLGVAPRTEGIWELRGLTNRGAANGSVEANKKYLSILCMAGVGDAAPTDTLLNNLREARKLVLSKYPNAKAIKGHYEVRPQPTSCPGPFLTEIIKNPAFWEATPIKPPVGTKVHVVVKGDTLSSIARKYSTTVTNLAKWNNITDVNSIVPGQRLNVAAPSTAKPAFVCPLPNVYLKEGDRGTHVFNLISQLAFWDYYRFKNDGVYGPATKQAVMLLQGHLINAGLYPAGIDGEFGPLTRTGWCRQLEAFYRNSQ